MSGVSYNLPELPPNMEWVIHAQADRFTVNLSYKVPDTADPDLYLDESSDDRTEYSGYVMSHTHKHPAVITRSEWEQEVTNAARYLWTHYTEGNRHAKWADEIMRRSR
jgi:hypothetical protein